MAQANSRIKLTVSFRKNVLPAETIAGMLILKSSWDFYGKSRPTYNGAPLKRPNGTYLAGLPDVWNITEENPNGHPSTIVMTEDRQHYLLFVNLCYFTGKVWTKDEYFAWFDDRGTPEKKEFVEWMVNELTGAMTDDRSHNNRDGMNNRHNYLNNTNTDQGEPLFAKLITGRARLKLPSGAEIIRNIPPHGPCIGFECIDASGDIWKYNPIERMDLFDEPCITGRQIAESKGGPYIVRDDLHYPYGNFNNKLVFPKWLPRSNIAFVPVGQTRPMEKRELLNKF